MNEKGSGKKMVASFASRAIYPAVKAAAVLLFVILLATLYACAPSEHVDVTVTPTDVVITPEAETDMEVVESEGETVYEIPVPTPTPVPTPAPTPTPVPIEDCKAEKGYVSGNGINLREGPGTDFPVIRELSRGAVLKITGIAGDWFRVEMNDGGDETGFLSAEFVGKGSVPLKLTVKQLSRHNACITANKVNMREEPSTKGKILEKLVLFTHVTITGETEKWYEVEYQDETGYVTKEYLEPAQGYYTAEELYLAAQIVHQEARGSLEGEIAVANVVYNRIRSRKYPNTIEDVVFQRGQFSPAENEKKLRSVRAGSSAIKAVLEIFVRGETILPKDVLYFRAARLGTQWASSRKYYGTYGGNCFYK